VLLDLRMPGLSGLETTQLMYDRSSERRAPVILLTAYTLEALDVRKAYELGVVDILQKPYLVEVLRTKVSVFVELFRQRELLRRHEALMQIQERERFEKELIGIVSHDLRNPLNTIMLASTSLAVRGGLDERAQKSLARIKSSAERATRLIHDLLDYTRARHTTGIPVQPQAGDLHEDVRQVVDELRIEHPSRAISFEGTGDAQGTFDPDRLSQVVTNLVTNAVRYGEEDRPISVRSIASANSLLLEVHNFGEPISPEDRNKLFEPLQQGAIKGSRSSRSLGLGLFIVDQIVRAHHGRVEIRSDSENGTTFSVSVPRTWSSPPGAAA
jgi:signal transduction histidine kinase